MTQAAPASPFPKRRTAWLAGLGVACLLGSIVAGILGGESPVAKSGANSLSGSGLGHTAFVELLRASNVPVIVTRQQTARRSENASLLLLIEPVPDAGTRGPALVEVLREAECPVLVVLPKWRGVESAGRLRRAVKRDSSEVERVLQAVDPVARVQSAPTAPAWTRNELGPVPDLKLAQTVRGDPDWEAIVASEQGFLVASSDRASNTVSVLADPDLLANHGLHRGNNAQFALELVAHLRDGDLRPVIVDETLHGLGVAESFWAQLFRFPLSLATLQAALAAGLLLWAGMRRFGAPEPAPLPYAPGKRFLIDHTAGLLESGGHHGDAIAQYLGLTVEDVARRLHAQATGRPSDVRQWLARVEAGRRTTERLATLEAEAAALSNTGSAHPRAALRLAHRIRTWKQEIVDGSDRSPVAR